MALIGLKFFPQIIKILFLIAFMGWMPAPLDLSIWQSIWVIEKQKSSSDFKKIQ